MVSEALWKETPVVAGNAGGIPLQMADGVGGVLVRTVEECAQAIVTLLNDRERARDLGRFATFGEAADRKGRERVREHFLLPRLLLNELELMQELAAGRPIVATERRDPVCGMAVSAEETAPEVTYAGGTYRFCSTTCQEQFLRNPAHYAGQTRLA